MTDTTQPQEVTNRSSAPCVSSHLLGQCDRCGALSLLRPYWTGEWVCGACGLKMAREDRRFGIGE